MYETLTPNLSDLTSFKQKTNEAAPKPNTTPNSTPNTENSPTPTTPVSPVPVSVQSPNHPITKTCPPSPSGGSPNNLIHLADLSSKSHILQKLPADDLLALRQTLVETRAPYRAIYQKHNLREKGISFTAFYNYARNFREQLAYHTFAHGLSTQIPDLRTNLSKILAVRVMEVATNEATSARDLERSVKAYKTALETDVESAGPAPNPWRAALDRY